MKYYKDNLNNVHAYELDGSQDHLIGDKVAMTVQEVEAHINPPKTQEQLDAEAKQAKEVALSNITVTTTSGKVFDGREKDIPLITGAIDASSILGITETQWKLHDNTVATITLAELQEALTLSMQAIGAIKVS